MKVLVTGAHGFIGKNLCENLKNIRDQKDRNRDVVIDEIFEYDIDTDISLLEAYCKECNFVYNLVGINRPTNNEEYKTNYSFLEYILLLLKKHNNKCPVMLSSSIQATLDNDYGISKKEAEDILFSYGKQENVKVLVYRFENVFGKWCRPNYNSVVATFCNNIANDLPITVNDRDHELSLIYIDDLVDELINALSGKENKVDDYCYVGKVYHKTLGEIVDKLYEFNNVSSTLLMPELYKDGFDKNLYSTYLSYLPKEKMKFELSGKQDDRGSFYEFIKSNSNGQFSINISKPNKIKGQHWHNSKWELFLVIKGKALIQERKIDTDEIIEFEVSGDKLEPVYMLPGYTHNIINLSDSEDLITLMWANEIFDNDKPDTYFEEVVK